MKVKAGFFLAGVLLALVITFSLADRPELIVVRAIGEGNAPTNMFEWAFLDTKSGDIHTIWLQDNDSNNILIWTGAKENVFEITSKDE